MLGPAGRAAAPPVGGVRQGSGHSDRATSATPIPAAFAVDGRTNISAVKYASAICNTMYSAEPF